MCFHKHSNDTECKKKKDWWCEVTDRLKSSPRATKLCFPVHVQGFSNVSPHRNHQRLAEGQTESPTPRVPDAVGLRWAWKFAFPVMLLLVQWTHFENHCLRALLVLWTDGRELLYSQLPCVATKHLGPLQSHLHFLQSPSRHLSLAVVSISSKSFYY